MIRKFTFLSILIALSLSLPLLRADVLDRIVATVNGHIILQSDWDDAVRAEAFLNARPLDQVSTTERKAALDRLIDQELLREQMRSSDFQHASAKEIDDRIQEIRKQYPDAQTDSSWGQLLTRYGITADELKQRVVTEIDLARLVDARLRPSVNIDPDTIESYYNRELLPQLRQAGAKQVSLDEVTPKIKELLTQQKVNELLVAWLQNLRSSSEIQTETSGDFLDSSQ
jgi:peptidyl-prolyl cis-trans isomerase SurA